MHVYLAACASAREETPVVAAWRRAAAEDRFQRHALTDDPGAADLILFVDPHLCADWRLRALSAHPLVREYRAKVLVYNERDHPWCVLPGLYCSMPASRFDERRQRACAYYGAIDLAEEARLHAPADLLFSFLGSRSHPIRRQVLRLTHPRALVEDTSGFLFYDRSNPDAYDRQKAHYLETLLRSKFVLCPRGAGTASIRLFETLAAGRVPVILSDEWVAPPGPDWKQCALQFAEADIASIPERLEAAEAQYPALSAGAQAIHLEWFASGVIFHRLLEECAGLLAARAADLRPRRNLRYAELAWQQAKQQLRGRVGQCLRKAGLRRSAAVR